MKNNHLGIRFFDVSATEVSNNKCNALLIKLVGLCRFSCNYKIPLELGIKYSQIEVL